MAASAASAPTNRAPVSKLDATLSLAALGVWAGFTLYIANRLVHGQVEKLGRLAQSGLVTGAFVGLSLLNVILVYAILGRRDPGPRLRLLIVVALLIAAGIDIAVLYGTWHAAQPVSV